MQLQIFAVYTSFCDWSNLQVMCLSPETKPMAKQKVQFLQRAGSFSANDFSAEGSFSANGRIEGFLSVNGRIEGSFSLPSNGCMTACCQSMAAQK